MVVNGIENILEFSVFQPGCVARVPELNALARETLLNQDKESAYSIVMCFQSLTYTCISTSVCHTLQRRLFSPALVHSFIRASLTVPDRKQIMHN